MYLNLVMLWEMHFRWLDLARERTSALSSSGHREDEPGECSFLFLFPAQLCMLVLELMEYVYEK